MEEENNKGETGKQRRKAIVVDEKKIREEWEKEKLYEADPEQGKKKFFITAAFPYPNSPQHIGHARTYTIADVYARFMRMLNYNVLFPMAFHVTGTPVLAMAKRLEEQDEELLSIFENIYGISREEAKKLTTPEALVLKFSREIEEGMKELGLSIDWRRKFYTFDKHFNKFIEWQFFKLKELGLLEKGEHPVPWSKKLNSAVGAHDTKGDVDPEIEEVVAIKFKFEDGYLLTSTYRPETVYGVTNLWVNENSNIVKARNKENREIYYLTEGGFYNLELQLPLEKLEKIKAKQLIGKKAINLATGEEIVILPAKFVDEQEGTGVVMSVPAHAPYDYVALRDLGKIGEIEIKKVIALEGYSLPAKEVVERLKISNQEDKKLEEATSILYKEEFHNGIFLVEKYKGMRVSEAKEKVKEDLIKENKALRIWLIANSPVYSRAGDRIVVKIVKDQWFIDYSNKKWKEKTVELLENMTIIPEVVKEQLKNTIYWLDRKACTRAKGLGTRFPFDTSQVIESLSDSTIYMAFYTIAHLIKSCPPESLDEEFFDYLFLGKGEPRNTLHRKAREEFLYWYPLDSRHTGADLIRNHLAFFLFNHTAIFPKEHWPKQIVVNGFVLMDGKKMSKSLGNILPLKKAISSYSADVVRFAVVSGAELLQDTDFNKDVVEGISTRLEFFKEMFSYSDKDGEEEIDKWLLLRLKRRIRKAKKLYKKLKLREIALELFYETYKDLKWYLKRKEHSSSPIGLKTFFKLWALALHPIIPYTSYAMLKSLGIKKLEYPEVEIEEQQEVEIGEEIVMSLLEDLKEVIGLVKRKGKEPTKAIIFIPEEWKFSLAKVAKEKGLSFLKSNKNELLSVVGKQHIAKAIKLLDKILPEKYVDRSLLKSALLSSVPLFESETGLKIEIKEESPEYPKSSSSLPHKLSILLE